MYIYNIEETKNKYQSFINLNLSFMRKLFTLLALLTVFFSAKAELLEDAFIDFSTVTEIPRFGWGGSESAFARLSLQDGCLHFASTEATDPSWDCQWFPIGGVDVEIGQTYTMTLMMKGDHAANMSAVSFGGLENYGNLAIPTDWSEVTVVYENVTGTDGNVLFQCGDYVGTWDIKWIKITHEGKRDKPAEWIELLKNGNAEKSWEDLGLAGVKTGDENNYEVCLWAKERDNHMTDDGGFDIFPAHIIAEPGNPSNNVFWIETPAATTEGDAVAWDSQLWLESPRSWKKGEQFKLSFRYKADVPVKVASQYHKQSPGDYLHWQAIGDISFTTEWQQFEQVVTVPDEANGAWSIAFNLNQNNHDPMNFYIDDLSWSQMKLEEGLFIASANTENNLVVYDLENALEFVYDDEEGAMKATVGTPGNPDSYVNEIMISTVRGNDKQYKANTIKFKGTAKNEEWGDYEEASNAKIKLPSQGVWNVYVDTDMLQMMVEWVEGESPKEPLNPEDCVNETEVVVNAVERDWKPEKTGEGVEPGTPQDGEEGIGEGQEWDNQFFLIANRALAVGEEVYVKFDYKAETAIAGCGTQNSKDAGNYLHWAGLGALDFDTEWKTFEKTIAIPSETAGNQNSWTFNLAKMKGANNYYFKNFVFMTADFTENLIEKEGTKNLWVKEGANTAAYEFGTDPDAINNVTVKATSNATYNLAGQRVSKEYKGIAIKNGQKFVIK